MTQGESEARKIQLVLRRGGGGSLIFFLLVPSVFRIRFNNNSSRRWQLELPAKHKRSLMNCGTFNMTGRQTQNYRIKPGGDTKSISRTLYSNASHTRGDIAHQCHTCHRSHENCSKFNHNFNDEFLQMLVGSDPFEMKACGFGQDLVGASLCKQ